MSGLVQPTERFRFAVEAHTPLMKFPHQGFFPGTCSCYIPSRRSKGIGEPTPIARNSSMDHANGDAVEDVVFDVANVRDAAREVLDAAQALRDLVFTDGFDEAAVPAAVDRVRNATDNLPATVVDEDKRVSAYRELVNLHNIDAHNPVLKVALREWEKKAKDLNKKVTRREARSADLTNQIFNIIGFFAVFQGVVLTAVTQLTQTAKGPLCGKIWFPIVLTGVGAVITIGGILYKFQGLRSFELTINTEKQAQQVFSCSIAFACFCLLDVILSDDF